MSIVKIQQNAKKCAKFYNLLKINEIFLKKVIRFFFSVNFPKIIKTFLVGIYNFFVADKE